MSFSTVYKATEHFKFLPEKHSNLTGNNQVLSQ